MATPSIEFTERQTFLRHWWPLLLLPVVITVVPALLQYSGHWPQNRGAAWIGPVTAAVITVLFFLVRLDTRLDGSGVYYRLSPLHRKWQHQPWATISRASVRTYDPLAEYGGWGLKGSATNRTYNVAGTDGLQLELTDGRRILLGTQQPALLGKVLADLRPA